MRMIRMSPDVHNTYVEVNPTHKKHANKKIDMYDKMSIVVGKDVARGSGAKSFDDVEIHHKLRINPTLSLVASSINISTLANSPTSATSTPTTLASTSSQSPRHQSYHRCRRHRPLPLPPVRPPPPSAVRSSPPSLVVSRPPHHQATSTTTGQKIMQFLVGLNEAYKVVRGNNLMMKPFPDMNEVYN
ncbi:hypothetical protein Cgig2_028807 [Carnegiea gigantea]|uniref:Uncharacterized protein n=1 Tax=Carnegiea gigantea TaxID=171969 RepID=A0A9Q1GSN5_9CARY|nr:hypothetical protein Cgig2_028807 [Carnegiea gigantea]